MADMGAEDWGDDNEIKGKVFKAVKYKASGKEHGAVGSKVDGLEGERGHRRGGWADVHNRYKTLFFDAEEDAQEGQRAHLVGPAGGRLTGAAPPEAPSPNLT